MKIVLLNPVCDSNIRMLRSERCQIKAVSLWPPLALCYCAAVLQRSDFKDVVVLDAEVEQFTYSKMIDHVVALKPDLLVIQDTTPTIKSDINISNECKQTLPNLKTVFIGLHSTVCPDEVLNGGVDYVVRNEPEYTLLELVKTLKSGGADLGSVTGLSYMHSTSPMHNAQRQVVTELDELPLPARDLIRNNLYINPVTEKPFTLIKTSRGCPFKCIYCTAQPYYGDQWRSRSVKSVINEIKGVIHTYGITDFLFHSDTFNLKKSFVLDLCKRIQEEKLDITWMSNCRVDLFDEEIASAMKDAGAYMISFGIESGVQDLLDRMQKGIILDQARSAVSMCKKYGLQSISYFVFGLPGETEQTVEETIRFSIDLDADIAQFFIATPFPGTQFYAMAKKSGWLTSNNWSDYIHGVSNVISYPDLSNEQLITRQKEAYKRFYFRPRKIWSYLKQIRSLRQLRNRVVGFFRFYLKRVQK